MKSQISNTKKYDLEERTAKFAESIIDFVKRMSRNDINRRIISQVVASSGSVGANYCEANEAESKRDFQHKIAICKKETKETKHWLRLLARTNPEYKNRIRELWQEAQELLLIFSAIMKSSKSNKRKFEN